MKIAIAITGSSATHLGIKLINNIPQEIELHIVFSKSAKYSASLEKNPIEIKRENCFFYDDNDIGASLASGSFKIDKFAIIPCSMNTLAKCSVGISDSLVTRAFAVNLKEKEKF